jgi:hypothetical protein
MGGVAVDAVRGGDTARTLAGTRTLVAAIALFVATLALYWPVVVPAGANAMDPLLTVPTSLSLLHDGDLALDEFGGFIDPTFYGVVHLDGHPYNRYPVGTSLLILPVVWLADAWIPGPTADPSRSMAIAAVAAKVLAALSVALLFALVVRLTGDSRLALGLALVFGFATMHLPIHAGGLFTHNAVIPLLLATLLLALREDGGAAWAAVPLVAAFVTRPTSAPVLVVVAGWMALHRARAFPPFASGAAGLGALFVTWSLWIYGAILPPYYTGYDASSPYVMSPARFAEGLAGYLVSPHRGVFVFTPILAFSLWGMALSIRSRAPHASFYRMLALAVVVHWLMISVMARKWWGGWSLGPRHVAEVFPLLVVLLVPAVDAARAASARLRLLLAPAAALALGWSLFVAVHGATSNAPQRWNSVPTNVDQHPERLWDWSDLQILRGTAWK